MQTKTVINMEYDELDALINEHIPSANGEYEFIAYQEANNGSLYSFDVDSRVAPSDREKIEKGDLMWQAGGLLDMLCEKGVIPAGEYIVEVFW